ncbi:succinate dehydrogenase, cytochrome b556 subunit [Methylomonas sp. MgM2]
MLANRPLSPHLQVYRLPLTGLISITHRITGILLSLGLILFVYVLGTIVAGESPYLSMQAFMSTWFCRLIFWGFIFALFFHFCHGIRHLIWDMGKGLERERLTIFAVLELIGSIALTATTFFLFERGIL